MNNKRFLIPKDGSVGLALEQASEFLDEQQCFYGHGTDNAWDEAVAAFMHISEFDYAGVEILHEPFALEHIERFEDFINRRAFDKVPMPYLTGTAWFCGHKFHVSPDTLIPRSPIAELIQSDFRPWLLETPNRILDLCCGSGCIGIAAALFNESAKAVLTDISADAMGVAEKNIQRYGLESRVSAIQSDLFENVSSEPFDLILCNPPYVDAKDLSEMPREYHHEPAIALESGEDGLDLTRRILGLASQYLSDTGALVLEVGNSWVHLEAAYPNVPFTWIEFEYGGQGVCVLTKKELEQYSF